MKITYNADPLCTTVELDDNEKKELWYKLKIEALEEKMYSAYFTLTSNDWYHKTVKPRTFEEAIEEATKELDPSNWMCDEGRSIVDKRVDLELEFYVGALRSTHGGDCTCFPASCPKCRVESLMGVDTIAGLNKHSAHHIYALFKECSGATLSYVIERLRVYEPVQATKPEHEEAWVKLGGKEQYFPRWKQEALEAYNWLVAYRNEHFKVSAND